MPRFQQLFVASLVRLFVIVQVFINLNHVKNKNNNYSIISNRTNRARLTTVSINWGRCSQNSDQWISMDNWYYLPYVLINWGSNQRQGDGNNSILRAVAIDDFQQLPICSTWHHPAVPGGNDGARWVCRPPKPHWKNGIQPFPCFGEN